MMIIKNSTYFFKSAIREKAYIFWCIAFPAILMMILITIFSSLYEVKRVNFDIYLVKNESGDFSNIIYNVFEDLSKGEEKIFNLKIFKDISIGEKLLEDLKKGKTKLIVEIPEGFDSLVLSNITMRMFGADVNPVPIKVYTLRHSLSSQAASMVVRSIIDRMNLEFVKRMTNVNEYKVKSKILGSKKGFSYVDFIFPGIVIIAIFFTGMFGIGQELSWYREGKILKRFQLTPISPLNFFLSYFLSRFYFFILQILVLSFVGKVIYKSSVNPFSFYFIFYVFLTMFTISTFGFFISAVAKNTNSANVIGQILNFPLQFLGGIYFPVNDVPWFVKWIVIINPITYLAAGIRDTLGIMPSPYPIYLTILIPLVYFLIFLLISIKKYRNMELT
uniref:ABC transporter permease n=1 Tax=Dictyoglomus thermophilum TaxID=14 RepID=A0A7C3MPK9_DICTH